MPFKPGDPNINRNGRPKTSQIEELRRALENEGKRRGQDFWQEVAKRAFTHDNIMLAVLKKLVPDLSYTEQDLAVQYTAMSVVRIEARPLDLDIGDEIPKPIRDRMQ
jgi:hypothetical protein